MLPHIWRRAARDGTALLISLEIALDDLKESRFSKIIMRLSESEDFFLTASRLSITFLRYLNIRDKVM